MCSSDLTEFKNTLKNTVRRTAAEISQRRQLKTKEIDMETESKDTIRVTLESSVQKSTSKWGTASEMA